MTNDIDYSVFIEKQLDSARQNLLDLTMRNRLINFRPSKNKSIRIVDEIPAEIYDILILQEKRMEFLAAKDDLKISEDISATYGETGEDSNHYDESDSNRASIVWEIPPDDTEISSMYTDKYLQTELKAEELQRRLFRIYQESNSIMEELGYSTLYLALGFLQWTETSDSKELRKAPLLLIPIEPERAGVRSKFKIAWNGEDVVTNISLREKLAEQGIEYPEFSMPDEKAGIVSYFKEIKKQINIMPGWKITNEIHLGFFSFAKFVMYKDLDPLSWPDGHFPVEHPLIQAIFGKNGEDHASDIDFTEEENSIDQSLTIRDLNHVLDADPSQIISIENIKRGRNLVVEGPPGTGKSQTIVNTISELLVAGKSVLFVSEKMAALQVVKKRLDNVGLGDFCLELHSRKTTRKEFVKTLENSMAISRPVHRPVDRTFGELEVLKAQLNSYAEILRTPFGNTGKSVFDLYCMKIEAQKALGEMGLGIFSMPLVGSGDINAEEFQETWATLRDLQETSDLVEPINKHPWLGCQVENVLPTDEQNIDRLLQACIAQIEDFSAKADELATEWGIAPFSSLRLADDCIKAAYVMANSFPVNESVLSNSYWDTPGSQIEQLIEEVQIFQGNRETLSMFVTSIEEEDCQDLDKVLKVFQQKYKNILRIFDSEFKQAQSYLRSLYVSPQKQPEKIIKDVQLLLEHLEHRDHIRNADTPQALFGYLWNCENSDVVQLKKYSEWMQLYRQLLAEGILLPSSMTYISQGLNRKETDAKIIEIAESLVLIRGLLSDLQKNICPDYQRIFGNDLEHVSIKELTAQISTWQQNVSKLFYWSQYCARRRKCTETIAKDLVISLEDGKLEFNALVPCFEANYVDEIMKIIVARHPEISNFIGQLHEKNILRFQELERQIIANNKYRIRSIICDAIPSLYNGASPNSETGIILAEINKKKRHMPIRKLMSQAGSLIQRIKPCFMMSPLSIAQFLDPRVSNFDVIIFDEASQVKPEDAIGALLRGQQLVVMGDTQQLPPTSFFDHLTDEYGTEDESTQIGDIESILHQCKRCFPVKYLTWHYRSRHDSLIAVSNQEYYDNRLLVCPAATRKSEGLGLQFVHLSSSIYDRGRSSVNREEAKRIASDTLEHYRRNPEKSLGVGTFNIKQQQAILEEIEMLLRANPEMEEHYKSDKYEHFFVKNLETIQGDERDVIMISVGFGFDRNRKLSLNFGPLNNEGGERRLNVLITRAREKCVVYANFSARDLMLENTSSKGLQIFKQWLTYAESGDLTEISSPQEDTDSPFEDSVFNLLRSNGYEVHKQVGCAGFRVDLAIVDSNNPGQYLLGIECDGARYHSLPVARDRDRLRQQILEGMGWKIYRIWSTDWYRNYQETVTRLLEAVLNVKNYYPSARTTIETAALESFDDIEYEKCDSDDDNYDEVPIYTQCTEPGRSIYGEIHEYPRGSLAEIVRNIVNIESPVHVEAVIKRVRELWGLNRTGQRIHDAVELAIQLAVREKTILRKNNFLWSNGGMLAVRCRQDENLKIELICDEEISAAVMLVIKRQFATVLGDLVTQISRVLGFKSTSANIASRIESVIRKMEKGKELERTPMGMLQLAS